MDDGSILKPYGLVMGTLDSRMRRNWKYWSRFFHKWISLFIGAQVFLWFVSGTVMSYLPIQEVRGNHIIKEDKVKFKVEKIKPISEISFNQPVDVVELKKRDSQFLYVFRSGENQVAFDAITGKIASLLNEQEAILMASKNILFPSPPTNVVLLDNKSREYKGDLPVWKIDYETPETYSLYVSPYTGEIKAVRNQRWRIFDFFWMLHIMDYINRENINSPWLTILSALSVILTISGFLLIISVFKQRRKRT